MLTNYIPSSLANDSGIYPDDWFIGTEPEEIESELTVRNEIITLTETGDMIPLNKELC